jgi:integrase/recombinase XerD
MHRKHSTPTTPFRERKKRMASFRLYRGSYKDRAGKTQETKKWYVEFRDHQETIRRLALFTSKTASEECGRNFVRLVDYNKATGGQTDPELIKWLSGLSADIKGKLAEWSIIAPERAAATKPLADHLKDWEKSLEAKGNSEAHVEVITLRATKVMTGCGFRFYSDIKASRVETFLHDLRQDKKEEKGISAQTYNFYLQAVKQFCRWMVKDRRATENPLDHLSGLNVKTDRRRDRRAFTSEELAGLMKSTMDGPDRMGMIGPERWLMYWLALETGLRSNEIRSLTKASFDLGESPSVTVEAGYSKRRRKDNLPLRSELTEALRSYLLTKLPTATAFPMPQDKKRAARMFREDVEAAGIAYVDADKLHSDFHALRHTFITNLARGGIHPKTAQTLARHSTITLTMDRYSHTLREEMSEALEVLPNIQAAAQKAIKTGTDNAPSESQNPFVWARCWARNGGFQETQVDSDQRQEPPGKGELKIVKLPQVIDKQEEIALIKGSGSVWESNPLRAFVKPATGFEDQGRHQTCKHSRI